jgi:hypothetical protein
VTEASGRASVTNVRNGVICPPNARENPSSVIDDNPNRLVDGQLHIQFP